MWILENEEKCCSEVYDTDAAIHGAMLVIIYCSTTCLDSSLCNREFGTLYGSTHQDASGAIPK